MEGNIRRSARGIGASLASVLAIAVLLGLGSGAGPTPVLAASASPDPCVATPSDCATIMVTVTGNGTGSIVNPHGGIDCRRQGGATTGTCLYTYYVGQGNTLPWELDTAPAAGSLLCFGDSCAAAGGAKGGLLKAGDLITDSADFRLANPETLTVKKVGTGKGSVSSSPVGITCGTDCTADYNIGNHIVLTAKPAGGVTFGGWSAGPCQGQGATCSFLMPAQATTVTARFTLIVASPSPTPAPTATPAPSPTEAPSPSPEPSAAPTSPAPTATATPAPSSAPIEPASSEGGGPSAAVLLVGGLVLVGLGFAAGYVTRGRRPGPGARAA